MKRPIAYRRRVSGHCADTRNWLIGWLSSVVFDRVAVADVDHAALARAVAETDARLHELVVVLVVLERRLRHEARAELQRGADDQVGVTRLHGGLPGIQRDTLIGEIVLLRDHETRTLVAGARIDEARREARRDPVRIGDPVVADERVRLVDLREAEVRLRGVEQRCVRLVAIRRVRVVQARLEGLDEVPNRRTERSKISPYRSSRSGSTR